MFRVPEQHRIKDGPYGSTADYGNKGAFRFELGGFRFIVVASDGEGWEHVSVHCIGRKHARGDRSPTWGEMSKIKDMFWGRDDLVVQYMVPGTDHINRHEHTLHMWRKAGTNDFCQRPPSILV